MIRTQARRPTEVLRYLAPTGGGADPLLPHWTRPGARPELGINFHQRALARCRERGIGAWVSIRMNDLH